jgi:excisionase family DNA binding protein
VAVQRKGSEAPSYLLPAEVADLLSVSPKTVSRWAKEGKLPFMKTLVGTAATPRPRSGSSLTSSGRSQPPELAI